MQGEPQNLSPALTVLEETLQQIENRVIFFSSHNISAENSLHPTQNFSVRSISQIITPLKYFDIAQTPLNIGLNTIYANNDNKSSLKWTIPAPSEGQDSVNEEEVFEPSFKWLVGAFIDCSLIQIDQPEAQRIQKGKVPQEWSDINSLMLTNLSKKIYLKSQVHQVEASIKKRFERYTWLKIKRVRQIFYKGKPSVIVKFADSNSAAFAYFSFSAFKFNRDDFGDQCQIYRVLKDQTRDYEHQKNWILLFFRRLPLTMTKDQLMQIINLSNCVKFMQQPIQIAEAKYTICKVSYLDEALYVCEMFNSKKIKDAKINLHPKSSKNWKAEEVMEQQQQFLQEGQITSNETFQPEGCDS